MGRFSSNIKSANSYPFVSVFKPGSCFTNTYTSIQAPQNSARFYQMWVSGTDATNTYWSAAFYAGGGWNYLLSLYPFPYRYPNYVMAGGEAGAVSGDHATIRIPMNFAHKLSIYPSGLAGAVGMMSHCPLK